MRTRWLPCRSSSAASDSLIRNGSRGLLWLEPLVEVSDAGQTRRRFGPVAPAEVGGLVAAGLGERHPASVAPCGGRGPALAGRQNRISLRQGWQSRIRCPPTTTWVAAASPGLRRALEMSPADVVAEVTDSGLRGRGGAVPSHIKWKTVLECVDELKFVCCNADEGDSGTFADRIGHESYPFMLIEGATIRRRMPWARARGTSTSVASIRTQWPRCVQPSRSPGARGGSGRGLGSSLTFDLHVPGGRRRLRGRRDVHLPGGQARDGPGEPPYNLFGKPTVGGQRAHARQCGEP